MKIYLKNPKVKFLEYFFWSELCPKGHGLTCSPLIRYMIF